MLSMLTPFVSYIEEAKFKLFQTNMHMLIAFEQAFREGCRLQKHHASELKVHEAMPCTVDTQAWKRVKYMA